MPAESDRPTTDRLKASSHGAELPTNRLSELDIKRLHGDADPGTHTSPKPSFAERHPDRKEHTALGLLLGAERDDLFGAPANDDDKLRQAVSNDETAHVVADVAATLPYINMVGAGFLRASMLFDLQDGQGDGFLSFLHNFLGGMALNRVTRSANFGVLKGFTAEVFGSGLSGEIGTHLVSGASFGAVRTVFDERTWRDADGDPALGQGLNKVVGAAALGGLVNIPASAFGLRVARAVTPLLSSGLMSRTVSGVLSGAASGGMFGSVDAFVNGGGILNAGHGFVRGALVGAISGGMVTGLNGLRQEALYAAANDFRPAPALNKVPGPVMGDGRESPFVLESLRNLGDAIDFKPTEPVKLSSLTPLLGEAKLGSYSQRFMNPYGPTKFWSRAQYSSNLFTQNRPAQVWQVGPTKILVPQDYAIKLEAVRELRTASEQPNPLLDSLGSQKGLLVPADAKQLEQLRTWLADDPGTSTLKELSDYQVSRGKPALQEVLARPNAAAGASPTANDLDEAALRNVLSQVEQSSPDDLRQALPMLKASMDLNAHPLGIRTLPEDMLPFLERMPDRAQFKEVRLLDSPYPWNRYMEEFDDWARVLVSKGKNFRAAAGAFSSRGMVEYFQAPLPDWKLSVERVTAHEQVHLNQEELYAAARKLDSRLEVTDYAYSNDHESEAELESEAFLGGSAKFLEALERAPVRMSLLARKLSDTLTRAKPENRSVDADQIQARIQFVEQTALPGVNARLLGGLNRIIDTDPKAEATEEAGLGNASVADAMKLLARLNPGANRQVQDTFLRYLGQGSDYQSNLASDLLVKMGGDTYTLQKLSEQVLQGPRAKSALETMIRSHDSQNPEHRRILLELTDSPKRVLVQKYYSDAKLWQGAWRQEASRFRQEPPAG